MAGTRVHRENGITRHLAFEPKVGALYLTRLGRTVKLTKIVHGEIGPRGDMVLAFAYVGLDGQPDRQGGRIDGFEMTEGVAARCLVRIAKLEQLKA